MSSHDEADSWNIDVINDHEDSQPATPTTELPRVVAAQAQAQAPIISSCNDKIRPLLDVIDRLRLLMVMKEGIQLPTIVVVGDQSSGKSSVLESLAGVNLPRSQGICTRVPLIIRLQNHACPRPMVHFEYKGKIVPTEESHIATAINIATDEVAGRDKSICNSPITLVVKKDGVPDLTMVDLPGITRVPVHGQPENIHEQIRDIIMQYITPKESIILNVLSATVDFSTCESIRMSLQVDKTGERTLAVVTKADKAPEGLLDRITANDVNIGLGYVCVRNRVGDESQEEARKEEARLFETNTHLSGIDKSMVGVPVLAQKLVQVQANIIAKCLPEIVKKISAKLDANVSELEKMPNAFSSIAEATQTLIRIIGEVKESLKKFLWRGEFDEYPDDNTKLGTARLVEMLDKFSDDLCNCEESNLAKDFLAEEIKVLEDVRGIRLPNFLPHEAFLRILQRKIERISHLPVKFAENAWDYIDDVVMSVFTRHSEMYYLLKVCTKRAAHKLVQKRREQSINRVKEIVQMEKLTGYTCNPDYMTKWMNLMSQQDYFISQVNTGPNTKQPPSRVVLQGIGETEIEHLRQHKNVLLLQQAFGLKMRMCVYWKIFKMRLVDSMALHLQYSLHNLVNNDMEEIVKELMGADGHGIERMTMESPIIAAKRAKLEKSIELLKESKDSVAKVMDRFAGYDY
ncbi:Dynamin-related protein 4C [Hibiscus syriacus]|uniref:Dynamin-related protein 4C n=1 Tax=Hibiscus syriacus TaxID=106335 RepID=A0A6A2Z5D9_HIBSY|nr:dynamin-related protein 4C-like [Hibiscus syriacus]KAE8686620.1 Dynamin-related protein 4C [Hibiscus syriacus]